MCIYGRVCNYEGVCTYGRDVYLWKGCVPMEGVCPMEQLSHRHREIHVLMHKVGRGGVRAPSCKQNTCIYVLVSST